MKKLPILSLFFLLFLYANLWGQNWSPLGETLNGVPHCGTNIGTTDNLSTKCIIGGKFTGTTSGLSSNLIIGYDNATGGFWPINGLNPATDKVVGFFKWKNSFYVYGYFFSDFHYGAMKLNSALTTATTDPVFKFSGSFASFGKIETAATDTMGNLRIFGTNLARLGLGSGTNLQAAKVGEISPLNLVTPVTDWTPTDPDPLVIPKILSMQWDSIWAIAGNFKKLGNISVTDFARSNGGPVTPVSTSANANTFCTSYSNGFLAWNGIETDDGVYSPGGLRVKNSTLSSLANGYSNINPLSVLNTGKNNVIFCGGLVNGVGSRIVKWQQSENIWSDLQSNLSVGSDTTKLFTVIQLPGDSIMVLGEIDNYVAITSTPNPPLPVELTSFTGQVINGKVVLVWGTQKEKENSGFFIERSSNQLNWEDIGLVIGKGTTSDPHNYDFVDQAPLGGRSYYRLRQVDDSEEISYSNIISVEIPMTDVKISPNPASENLVIEFTATKEGIASLNMIDAAGKIVHKEQIETIKGLNTVQINTFEIIPGNYNLTITVDDQTFIEQVIISR